ncbi:molybdenum cofactor synthesis domain-containing protein [Dehalogenimonas alkenigignens]|uniref:Molybdopterin molybdenumtransferase n=1 Tax=Dehalogenimonas alkenigignens TaxID=1217799 RepID=A0A0W0GIY7_9CHLR|nr:gephyrin-like molybdotransferase Glp [Dehalogenimonas alkenigignens]KTB48494.1 molybdopterin molybdochelatase [Dehalogenimonas alkenigignens]PVV85056.1 molybdenum cofactor biosynthesis protein [Dehalogenimonas alkenigignens]
MKPFGRLLDFDNALAIVLNAVVPVDTSESVPIKNLFGRVLAEDLRAIMSIPPFSRAAMDGYAVIAEDTFGAGRRSPKSLRVVDQIFAGDAPFVTTEKGKAVQIATGAPMPAGADAVVMVEETERVDEQVNIYKAVYPGANIGQAGEDIKQGEIILKQGTQFDAGKIGVLASQGFSEASVFRKPRVAIMPTGEEIAPAGQALKPGQIYDINSHTLAAVVGSNGGEPVKMPIAEDKPLKLRTAIEKALENDMVVISGGSSVGERDLMFSILEDLGKVLFHGIQVKPGKPTMFAVIDGKPVLGMPGYPTSCLINGHVLLAPAVRKMARLPVEAKRPAEAMLAQSVPGSVGRRQFLPVKLVAGQAWPLFKESGAITATAEADGYLDIPANIDILEKGETVRVFLFNG